MNRRSITLGIIFSTVFFTAAVVGAAGDESAPAAESAGETDAAPAEEWRIMLGLEARGTLFPVLGAGGELQVLWTSADGRQPETIAFGLAAGGTRYLLSVLDGEPSEILSLNLDFLVLGGWIDRAARSVFRFTGRAGVMAFIEPGAGAADWTPTVHCGVGLQAGFMTDEAGTVSFLVSPSIDWNLVYDDEAGELTTGYFSLNLGIAAYLRL